MANLVESIKERVKFPEKMDLSPADRQLLHKLAAAVEELKQQRTVTEQQLTQTEERLLAQIEAMLNETRTAMLQAQEESMQPAPPQEITPDFSELKHFISETSEQKQYQIKSLIGEAEGQTTAQLQSILGAIKDEEILNKLPTLFTQLSDTEQHLNRQLRTVKIMMGVTIWISLLSLIAIAGNILGFI